MSSVETHAWETPNSEDSHGMARGGSDGFCCLYPQNFAGGNVVASNLA